MAKLTRFSGSKRYLPEEIIFDILSRLPPKYVVRSMSVSKSWYALIKSPTFIATHLSRSIGRTYFDEMPSSCYLLSVPETILDRPCTVIRDNIVSFDQVDEMYMPFELESDKCIVFGSCNGVVGLTDGDEDLFGCKIYMWNPSIRKLKTIRGTRCEKLIRITTKVYLGLWHDSLQNDYKLMRIIYFLARKSSVYDEEHCQVEVYSVNLGSWRKIDNLSMPGGVIESEIDLQPASVNSSLNWMATHSDGTEGNFILSFDTIRESFQVIELPDYSAEHDGDTPRPRLLVYEGCLAIFVTPDFDSNKGSRIWSLWVMRKFGVKESWVKQHHIDNQQKVLSCLGCTKNDEVMILAAGTTNCKPKVTYNFERKCYRQLGFINWLGIGDSVVDYTESLVFLDQKNEISDDDNALADEDIWTFVEEGENSGMVVEKLIELYGKVILRKKLGYNLPKALTYDMRKARVRKD